MVRDGNRVTHRMLKYLRVPQDGQPMEIVSSVLEETVRLIDIEKWSKCVPVDDFFELFHLYARSSKSISKLLGKAEQVYLIVVTLGENLGNGAKEYFGKKEIAGLSFRKPIFIDLKQGAGQTSLSFPDKARISYFPASNITSAFASEKKGSDVRISFSAPPFASSLTIEKRPN